MTNSRQLNLLLPLHAEPELPLGNYWAVPDLVRSTAKPRRKALRVAVAAASARSEARTHAAALANRTSRRTSQS